MKQVLAVLPLLLMSTAMFAQSGTLTFTYGPRDASGYWAYLLTVNGQAVDAKTYVTYFSSTEFTHDSGWSVYAPALTQEGCSITYGQYTLDSRTGLYTQNDSVSCGQGWTGALSESFTAHQVKVCNKYHCTYHTDYFSQGGIGALTKQ